MGPEEIRKILGERPFRPFRIHMSDGASYDVRHPELVLVAKRQLIVGVAKPGSDILDDFSFVNILHITRIEPIEDTESKPGRKRSA